MTKKNTTESTKERILNAAKSLFAEQSYQKTTIAAISKQAGLSDLKKGGKSANCHRIWIHIWRGTL